MQSFSLKSIKYTIHLLFSVVFKIALKCVDVIYMYIQHSLKLGFECYDNMQTWKYTIRLYQEWYFWPHTKRWLINCSFTLGYQWQSIFGFINIPQAPFTLKAIIHRVRGEEMLIGDDLARADMIPKESMWTPLPTAGP